MDPFARFRRLRNHGKAAAASALAPEPAAAAAADAPAPPTTTILQTARAEPQNPTPQTTTEWRQSRPATAPTGETSTSDSRPGTRGDNSTNLAPSVQQQHPVRESLQAAVLPQPGSPSRPSSSKRSRGPPPSVPRSPRASALPALPVARPGKITLELPKMPAFLNISTKDIRNRYEELQWLERHRMQSSAMTPAGRWARVSGPHLRTLDRYNNIQPWEKNRVRLRVPPGQVDYINASPVVLTTTAPAHATRPPDRYIAMQGPKRASVNHVWRMVYEQLRSPAVMVMLTETHEGVHEKCYPYYPQSPDGAPILINEHDEFGDGFLASVQCEAVEETPFGTAIELRRVVLRVHRRPETAATGEGATSGENGTAASVDLDRYEDERVVYHFLYRRWPDFGVPTVRDLDSFFGLMRLSAEKNADDNNPRIVHCSAGVGRSGTFIALEHLVRELDAGVLENYDAVYSEPRRDAGARERGDHGATPDAEHPSDPFAAIAAAGSDMASGNTPDEACDLIFTTVNQLREQRCTMVQSEAQYRFIYQVMRRLWQAKYGANLEDDKSRSVMEKKDADDSSDEDDVEDWSEPAAKRVEVDPFTDRPW